MQKRWLLALALTSALTGCYVEPYPEDPFGPEFPEDPFEDPFFEDPSGLGKPDFVLESLTGPFALSTAPQELLRARLCNRGDTSSSTEVSFFLSKDALLDSRDVLVATSSRISVPAEGCREVTGRVGTLELAARTYHLIAVADADDRVSEQLEGNNEREGGDIRVDFNAPPAPLLSWVDSGSMQLPRLIARSETNAKIRVYAGDSCYGEPVADGISSDDSYCEMPIDVGSHPASSYSARAYDYAGNASGCSSIPTPSQYDTTPPADPVVTEANWQYGTTQHGLLVRGTTEPGAEVGVFVDVACTGFPAATVFAGSNGAFTAELTVAASSPGSIRRVYVAARDAAYNESECVEGPTYETPCQQGYANCDGNPANGCEVNLMEDVSHCGACGTSCEAQGNATGVCVAGTCGVACPVGAYDCDGNPANGCESTYACNPTTCTIDRSAELMITALSVVEDPVRTAPGGAWHFGTLMRAMAGDQDPSTMVRSWLKTWMTAQTVNGLTLPARTQMMNKVLGPWETRSGGANRPLDFSRAPFRLLAITNRMDLRQPGVQAGEGRFVFGVLDPSGAPLEFTVILEYALPGGTPEAIQRWARDWHELGQLGLNHPSYKVKLQALTDRFAKSGVLPGRPFGNALNQLRTNEVDLADPWEMREYTLTTAGLQPATVKLTPDFGFENSNTLRDFIQANQADVLAERHSVPESFAGRRFLAAGAKVPEDFFWRVPGVSSEARHKFSLNTCSGCHSRETRTEFVHVAPRAAGQQAALSAFLRGGTVFDPVTQVSRSFDDLGRRAEDLATLVCGTQGTQGLKGVETFGGFPAPSNLPRARVH
ncbi:hypothetical protein [Hyalangium sp.]|uniref:hypothetical protein n=1 Tax=Hyalangium sp. TaxID=2028555 RepID=UPI002D50AFFA|nr:hypothetical protein [Hyalangium sp.]HYI02343.1 hypothetical protein [Hyalangium sp.]